MISWHNAPLYKYCGYVYNPSVDEYCDGIRKANHNVYKQGREHLMHSVPDFVIDALPYHWLTYDEFAYHVDMMRGNVYGD